MKNSEGNPSASHVSARAEDPSTYLSYDGQDPRLVVIVPVGTHPQIDLLRERVRFVGRGELEDAMTRRRE